eukprot:7143682-Pyramimonas_sp.AAC.1
MDSMRGLLRVRCDKLRGELQSALALGQERLHGSACKGIRVVLFNRTAFRQSTRGGLSNFRFQISSMIVKSWWSRRLR